ncbi:GNAT family N-acetyltransferase [Streptomyces sp. DT190]|jgi:predicted GNAT family acetyltransferase|uniref:GNAT family N-acetyltransferase n=1 Tax=unclassified Streptomyces TaxID=2593676 RepID=UPI003CEB3244
MSSRVTDDSDLSRYEIFEGEELAGLVEYHRFKDEIAFLHTEIEERFAGRGLGGTLARAVLDDARRQNLRVMPYCPFIRKFIKRHAEEYTALVPEGERARFGL